MPGTIVPEDENDELPPKAKRTGKSRRLISQALIWIVYQNCKGREELLQAQFFRNGDRLNNELVEKDGVFFMQHAQDLAV